MAPPAPEYPEADRIIDEVLQGKRVFALWPGTGALVTVIMLQVLAMGVCLAPVLMALLRWLHEQHAGWEALYLVGLALGTATIVVPAALVTRGVPYGYRLMVTVTRVWLVAAVLLVGAAVMGYVDGPVWLFGAAALMLAVAQVLEHREACLVYVVLRQRLAVKLAEGRRGTTPLP